MIASWVYFHLGLFPLVLLTIPGFSYLVSGPAQGPNFRGGQVQNFGVAGDPNFHRFTPTLSLFYKQRSKKETSRCLFQIIQKRLVVA